MKKHERTHDETECLYPQCGILIVGKFILYVLCLWNVFVFWVTHLIVFELSLTPSNKFKSWYHDFMTKVVSPPNKDESEIRCRVGCASECNVVSLSWKDKYIYGQRA